MDEYVIYRATSAKRTTRQNRDAVRFQEQPQQHFRTPQLIERAPLQVCQFLVDGDTGKIIAGAGGALRGANLAKTLEAAFKEKKAAAAGK